jgi:hypothetical protein
MEREYDLFETLEDGEPIWRCSVIGIEPATAKLEELAAATTNEVCIMYIPTKAVVAKMSGRKVQRHN